MVDSVSPEAGKSTSFCFIFHFIIFYAILFSFYLVSLVFSLIHLNTILIFFIFLCFLLDTSMFILQELLNPMKQGVAVENSIFARVAKFCNPYEISQPGKFRRVFRGAKFHKPFS